MAQQDSLSGTYRMASGITGKRDASRRTWIRKGQAEPELAAPARRTDRAIRDSTLLARAESRSVSRV